MKTNYHVFERSDYDGDDIEPRCAVCGNKESAATGTGHVGTENEAYRLNRSQPGRAKP